VLPALFQTFPNLVGRLPFRPLGQFPTAIERVPEPLPGGCELWVKREDLAGQLYGGNKVRKLELMLASPAEQPAAGTESGRRLITMGTYGSNQVLATGLYGRALGFSVEAILFPQPSTASVQRAVQAQLGAGVKLWPFRSEIAAALGLARWLWRWPSSRVVPIGGSSALGNLGWWSGGLEIAAQVVAGVSPRFDAVYVALGSGGTSAGLLLGLGSAAKELVPVRVAPWPVASELTIRIHAYRCRSLLTRLLGHVSFAGPTPRLRVDGRFIGRGYGYPSQSSNQAVRQAAGLGLTLDPVYTGKVFATVLADAQAGRLAGKRVLLINTYNSRDISGLVSAGDLGQLPGWFVTRLADRSAEPR
jgi:D-cysteine desulfhydrase